MKAGTVDNALRALKTKNIILDSELKRGDYRIPTISFAAWIKARNVAQKTETVSPSLFDPSGDRP